MFLLNSRYFHFCATLSWLPTKESSFSRSYGGNLPSSFSTIFSTPWYIYTCPPVSVCGTAYAYDVTIIRCKLFPGQPKHPMKSINHEISYVAVIYTRWRNINLLSIDYDFRPRLRSRLTLPRSTWDRNPWTFGGSDFHTSLRYLCQHSHFHYLQNDSRLFLLRFMERSATVST